MSQIPVIHLDSVSVAYGKQLALNQFNLTVPPGVVFALLGENGAGKTTAIRTMLGLVRYSGTLTVLGLDSRRDSFAIRNQIGYVSEQPKLYDWMTVDEIGWFTAGFYPEGFLDEYRALTTRLQLTANRKIKQLSKGMKSKVSLALALAHRPSLLILDEPTSGLDTMVRREFLESMVDFATDGKTVFLSSHQINEVERVADWVAIVHDGQVLTCETLDGLKGTSFEFVLTLQSESIPFELPIHVLHREQRGRSCKIMARGNRDTIEDELRNHQAIADFEIRHPSLEDIFVAYMRQGTSHESFQGESRREVSR